MTTKSEYNKVRLQLYLMTLESKNDREAVARNLLTETEARQRAELRGMQRQNICVWLRMNGGNQDVGQSHVTNKQLWYNSPQQAKEVN